MSWLLPRRTRYHLSLFSLRSIFLVLVSIAYLDVYILSYAIEFVKCFDSYWGGISCRGPATPIGPRVPAMSLTGDGTIQPRPTF